MAELTAIPASAKIDINDVGNVEAYADAHRIEAPPSTTPGGQAAFYQASNASGDRKSLIPTIGGRKPINSQYAGQVHTSGVRFTEQGFPDFSPFSVIVVKVEGLVGRYRRDAALANQAAGIVRTPEGYVWHLVEDGSTMQLLPKEKHDLVDHTGGAAVIRNGGFDK